MERLAAAAGVVRSVRVVVAYVIVLATGAPLLRIVDRARFATLTFEETWQTLDVATDQVMPALRHR